MNSQQILDTLNFNDVDILVFALSFSRRYGHLVNNALAPIVAAPGFIQDDVEELLGDLEDKETVSGAELQAVLGSLRQVRIDTVDLAECIENLKRILSAMNMRMRLNFLETGEEPSVVDPVEYVRSYVDSVNKSLAYDIEFESDEDFNISSSFDTTFLLDFIDIFIRNAVNAMDKDEKRIRVKARKDDEGLVLEIEDNGVGISKRDLSSIFSPGYITKDREDQDVNSIGLGLTRAYLLTGKLGGRIVVRSCHKVGTVFTIHIPFSDKVRLVD